MHFKTLILSFLPYLSEASLLTPLPADASEGALKFQPLLDIDDKECVITAAIDINGTVNDGQDPDALDDHCSGLNRLSHLNVYARERCNHYWCAYMYAYYTEADERVGWITKHRHDWEHVIVWTLNDQVTYVSWSANGDYTTAYHTEVLFDGNHPKFVLHSGWFTYSSLRRATGDDNKTLKWISGALLSWEKMDQQISNNLNVHDFKDTHLDLKEERFAHTLFKNMPADAKNNEGFSPWEF
ncbi:unnamed protein product [Fusarium equiseti]|uniref:Uncharacterized protein n=1 Tax=Fusarium equiseti TaxID=61235 RepID=A0A8J2N8Y6_FUSEQ|nr:unnamed protein product [Fusarium equiseti]